MPVVEGLSGEKEAHCVQYHSTHIMEEVMVRRHSWIDRLVVCKDCKHVAMDHQRYLQHLKEAKHIHSLRNMAYR